MVAGIREFFHEFGVELLKLVNKAGHDLLARQDGRPGWHPQQQQQQCKRKIVIWELPITIVG
jgi:hypothetical protein